jgi:excisionase family DNA binding protein
MRLHRFFRSAVLSVKEASERFRIPKGTLYDYVRKGKIKVIRHPLGWGFLIPESEIPKLQAISEFYLAKAAKEGEVRP